MAVLTRDELMDGVKTIVDDVTTDECVKFLEDLSDTLDAFDNDKYTELVGELEKLKSDYERMEMDWRKKYTDRFFAEKVDDIEEKVDDIEKKVDEITIDDLLVEV